MIAQHLLPLLILSLLSSAATVKRDSTEPIHVPLERRAPSGPRTPDQLVAIADRIRRKYNKKGFLSRRDVTTVPTTDQEFDSIYTGIIQVGTPARSFSVILDTGSSDLWLASSACTSCSTSTPRYSPASSSTYTGSSVEVPLSYDSGEVEGVLSYDTVTMGGYTVNNQVMVAVDMIAANSSLLTGSVSGLMGLGFATLAATTAVPFWETVYEANQFTYPYLSFWMARFNDVTGATTTEPGGTLTLGGTNTSLFTGTVEFINMPIGTTPGYWLQNIVELTVQGKQVPITIGASQLSAIDTGTTLIGGPENDVTAFWEHVPGSVALSGNLTGFWSYPCGNALDVTINFGGTSWLISDADMNAGSIDDNTCAGAIFIIDSTSDVAQSPPGAPIWIIGDAFLKNVYSVFRASPPAVGFARLSTEAEGSGTHSAPATSPTSGTSSTPSNASSRHRPAFALVAPFLLAIGSYFVL